MTVKQQRAFIVLGMDRRKLDIAVRFIQQCAEGSVRQAVYKEARRVLEELAKDPPARGGVLKIPDLPPNNQVERQP